MIVADEPLNSAAEPVCAAAPPRAEYHVSADLAVVPSDYLLRSVIKGPVSDEAGSCSGVEQSKDQQRGCTGVRQWRH